MSKPQHEYHLVNPSPLPIATSISVLIMMLGAVGALHDFFGGKYIFILGLIMMISCAFSWWWDIIDEGRNDKAHSFVVQKGISLGMLLFIMSEIMFFFAFFWGFFKFSIFPVDILDGVWGTAKSVWPPEKITTLDPWHLPFTNTLILLLSGTTVTWAHYALLKNDQYNTVRALTYTIILGICFTLLQIIEYSHAEFKFSDGIYPSIFYMITGFHGAHVILGTIFLATCLYRAKNGHFLKPYNHLGFTFAAWYWHFVDVVWLFLFIFVYVWGS